MTTLCLDNTFVSHYLDGENYTRDFLKDLPENTDVYVPMLVRYEAYVPAFQQGGNRDLSRARRALSGFQRIGFNENHAMEAAEIRAYLSDKGEKIGAPDVLIAGIARSIDADIVSSDGHFQRVPNLSVRDPQS